MIREKIVTKVRVSWLQTSEKASILDQSWKGILHIRWAVDWGGATDELLSLMSVCIKDDLGEKLLGV